MSEIVTIKVDVEILLLLNKNIGSLYRLVERESSLLVVGGAICLLFSFPLADVRLRGFLFPVDRVYGLKLHIKMGRTLVFC
jgi:hypothetical protein